MFEGHQNDMTSLVISPNGHLIGSGPWENLVHIWDIETGQHKTLSIMAPSDVGVLVAYHCRWHADGSGYSYGWWLMLCLHSYI
jgi:WD40 repeat protein